VQGTEIEVHGIEKAKEAMKQLAISVALAALAAW